MHLPKPLSCGSRITGIAAALMLTASALQAREFTELPPLSGAAPDLVVLERIHAFEAGTGRAPLDLASFEDPAGQPVYLFTPLCCDQFNRLYDAEGRYICAPSGGLDGAGDGLCPVWARGMALWHKFRAPAPTRRAEPVWPPR